MAYDTALVTNDIIRLTHSSVDALFATAKQFKLNSVTTYDCTESLAGMVYGVMSHNNDHAAKSPYDLVCDIFKAHNIPLTNNQYEQLASMADPSRVVDQDTVPEDDICSTCTYPTYPT